MSLKSAVPKEINEHLVYIQKNLGKYNLEKNVKYAEVKLTNLDYVDVVLGRD